MDALPLKPQLPKKNQIRDQETKNCGMMPAISVEPLTKNITMLLLEEDKKLLFLENLKD